jgi:hypothetical protein
MFHNMCHKVLPASRSSIPPQPQKEISSAIIPFGWLVGLKFTPTDRPIFVSSGKVVAEPHLFGVILSVIFFQ